jgi:tRNA (Thr-GGU) A37 N-methylase
LLSVVRFVLIVSAKRGGYADGQVSLPSGRVTVEVFPECATGLRDLDGFERIWLVRWFDRAMPAELRFKPIS